MINTKNVQELSKDDNLIFAMLENNHANINEILNTYKPYYNGESDPYMQYTDELQLEFIRLCIKLKKCPLWTVYDVSQDNYEHEFVVYVYKIVDL